MKRVAAVAGCLLVGCLTPVAEGVEAGVDAGVCREPLGVVANLDEAGLGDPAPGEHRGGRYFLGAGLLIDDRSFQLVPEDGGASVQPCSSLVSPGWWHSPEATFSWLYVPRAERTSVLLYEYTDQLSRQLAEACGADGGFGPTAVLLDLGPYDWVNPRAMAIAKTAAGFLTCQARVDDAGVAREMWLYRPADGAVVSSLPGSAESCLDLRPPLATTFSFGDGGGELIDFDTRRQVARLPPAGWCRVTLDGGALCGARRAATLVGSAGWTEVAREENADFYPMLRSARDRQYVRRISSDGGYAWYWSRNGALELLDEGMPASTIGDFDDANVFYGVARRSGDGGHQVEFERRCLPR